MANVGNPERVRWPYLAHSGANQNTGFASYTVTGYQQRKHHIIRGCSDHYWVTKNKFPLTKYD